MKGRPPKPLSELSESRIKRLSHSEILLRKKLEEQGFFENQKLEKEKYKEKSKEKNRKKYTSRKECLFNIILKLATGKEFYRQFPIATKVNSTYRLDFYLPEAQLIIEYDEEAHKRKEEKDTKRMKDIIEHLSLLGIKPKVIRVEEGKEEEAIKKIQNYLIEKGINIKYVQVS